MAVAVFDYAAWALRYPTLAATVDQATATDYFSIATGFLDNTDSSPVADVTRRLMLLGMITAHIAVVFGRDATAVGRISDTAEGTTKVAFSMPETTRELEAYFAQTQYGATYWSMTNRYRRAFYVPRC